MEALRAGEAIMLEKQKVERRRDPPSLKDEAQQSIRWISGLGWAGLAKRAGGSRAAFPGRAKRLVGFQRLSALPVGEHRRAMALSCSGLLREQTRVAEDGPARKSLCAFCLVGTLARCWGMCDNKHFGRLQSFSKKRKKREKRIHQYQRDTFVSFNVTKRGTSSPVVFNGMCLYVSASPKTIRRARPSYSVQVPPLALHHR